MKGKQIAGARDSGILPEHLSIRTVSVKGVLPRGPWARLTYYGELQTKGILPGFVGSHARIGPCVALSERVDEQRVDPRLSDQHLVGGIW